MCEMCFDGSMGWMMVLWWVAAALALGALVWFVVRAVRPPGGGGGRGEASPEGVLKRRYASGEIDREEYHRRLSDLHGAGPQSPLPVSSPTW